MAAVQVAAASLFLLATGFYASTGYAAYLHAVDPCIVRVHGRKCEGKLHFFGSGQGEAIGCGVLSAFSILIPVAWAAFQLCHRVLPALRNGCVWVASGSLRRIAEELARSVREKVGLLFPGPEEAGPDHDKVRRVFEKLRVGRARTTMRRTTPVAVAALLFVTMPLASWHRTHYAALLQGPDAAGSRDLYRTFVFGGGVVQAFVMCAAHAAVDVLPSLATPCYLDAVNVFFASAWGWGLAVSTPTFFAFNHHWIMLTRFMHAMYLGNPRLTAALNLALLAVSTFLNFAHPREGVTNMNWVIARDVLVFLIITVASWSADLYQWTEARLLVRARKSDHSSALVGQLLSHVCDAVPRLDARLCLAEPCPSLSALLLRGGPIATGAPFIDLVSFDDVERLRGCLIGPDTAAPNRDIVEAGGEGNEEGGAAGAAAFAGLCHIRLRAASSVLVPVSIFYSCMPDLDGLPTYLLGIREERESAVTQEIAAAAPPPPPPRPRGSRMPALTALPEVAAAAADDLRSPAWSSASSEGSGEALGTHAIWVDGNSDQLRVLGFAPGFGLLGGARGACGALSEWLSSSDLRALLLMMDMHLEMLTVTLRPPGGGHYACTFARARRQAAVPDEVAAVAGACCAPVRLLLRPRAVPVAKPQEHTNRLLQQCRSREGHLTCCRQAQADAPIAAQIMQL